METNRGAFLATAAGIAGGAAFLGGETEAVAAPIKVLGDRAGLEAVLQLPARHRVIMGAPFIHNGSCFKTAHMLTAYQFADGEPPGTVNLCISLYGPTSIMLMMNDAFWAEEKAFELCTDLHDLPPVIVKGPVNPFYKANSTMNPHDDPEDPKGFYLDLTGEALTRRGAHWFICANAVHTASRQLSRLENGTKSPAYFVEKMRHSLMPKAFIVPSGEQALIRAQELKFSYVAAT